MAAAASAEVKVPLNLSVATKMRMAQFTNYESIPEPSRAKEFQKVGQMSRLV
jgi:hypothetical protein